MQKEHLGSWLQAQAASHPDYRWVAPDALHLTLRFLGGITADQQSGLTDNLGQVSASPFQFQLGRPGHFGSPRRVRVLWLGVQSGADALSNLARHIEVASRAVGLPAEERPFQPHLTLARCRSARGCAAVELADLPALPQWRVDAFHLFRSELGRQGARYTIMQSFQLG